MAVQLTVKMAVSMQFTVKASAAGVAIIDDMAGNGQVIDWSLSTIIKGR